MSPLLNNLRKSLRENVKSFKKWLRASRKHQVFSLSMILLLFVPIITIFISLLNPSQVEAAWFDMGYSYRQKVTLTNSGTLQTDFQVMFTIDTAALVTAGKMQSDCDDIRFTDINGKVLSYWLEPTTCNTSATKVWSKINNIFTTGTDLYFYYGNPTAVSQSSTVNTFIRELDNVKHAFNFDEASWVGTFPIIDSSGGGNPGHPEDGATQTTGKFGKAADFNGTTAWINSNSTGLPSGSQARTVAFWMRTPSFGVNQSIYTYGTESIGQRFEVGTRSTTNWVVGAYNNVAYGTQSVPAGNTWAFVVISLTGTNASSTTVRINNTSYTVSLQAGADLAVNTVLNSYSQLGTNITRSSLFYSGQIDNFRLYSDVMSAAEASDLYGNGSNREGYTTANYAGKELVKKYDAGVSIGTYGTEEVGPGPVLNWKLDEGVGSQSNDSSGRNNNGTLTNSPTWQTEDKCVLGKCLNFNGSNNYILGPSSNTVKMTGALTISAWVRPSLIDGNFRTIAGRWQTGVDQHYLIQMNTDNKFYFYYDYNGGDSSSGQLSVNSMTIPSLDRWYLVSGVFDPTTTSLKIYINGVLEGTNTNASLTGGNAGSVEFTTGSKKNGSNTYYEFFNGNIDEVKLFPYARSSSQIKADFNYSSIAAITQEKYLSDGLVGYWKMDESSWMNNCSTGSVIDSSGSNFNGSSCPNSTGPTGGAAGKFGNAGLFDGSDDYVSMGNVLNMGTQDMSVSAWFKTSTATGAIVGKSQFSAISGRWSIVYDGGILRVIFAYGTSVTLSVPGTWNDNVWHNIIAVFDRDGNVSAYIDGNFISSASISAASVVDMQTTCPLYIGAYQNATCTGLQGGYYFNGSIDEVRIYRKALTQNEVSMVYSFAPSPIIHWKLDENTGTSTSSDSSGNGYNATLNSIVDGNWVPGKLGSALDLDGSSDFISLADNPILTQKTMTWEMWFNLDLTASAKGTNHTLLEHENGPDPYRAYDIFIDSSSNNIVANIYKGVGDGRYLQGSSSIAASTWYHVALTQDGSTARLYVNGNLEASGSLNTSSTSILNGDGILTIGDGDNGYGFKTNGKIDDIRFYNYARNQQQIVEDMNGESFPSITGFTPAVPIALYSFNEQSGQTINNKGSSGATLNGTLGANSSLSTDDPTWKTKQDCKINSCLSFDGGDRATTSININPSVIANLSISSWVKRTGTPGSFYSIVTNDDGGYDRGLNIGSDGQYHIFAGRDIDTNIDSTLNQWDHVVANWSASEVSLFKNGKKVFTTSGETITSSASNANIGSTPGLSLYFEGLIDEVKIFNTNLSPTQSAIEYNASGFALDFGSSAQSDSTLLNGGAGNPPVAEWKFDEKTGTSANDTSGNGNTATLTNSPTWTTGKFGAGLSFDGTDDIVDGGSATIIDDLGPVTFEAWFYANSLGEGGLGRIFEKQSSTTANGYRLQMNTGNSLIFAVDYGTTDIERRTNTSAFALSTWNHVVVTWDGSATAANVRIYINGTEATYASTVDGVGGRNLDNAQNFRIGNTSDGSRTFDGKIDNVVIYNYIRNRPQISYDYNRGAPVAWWKMDECQGGTLNDSSGNNLSGTITIGALGTQSSIGTCNTASSAWGNGSIGKFNSSFSLDGNDDFATVTSSALIAPSEITVTAWINPDGLSAAGNIVSKGDNSGYRMRVFSNGTLDFIDRGATNILTTTSAVTNNSWSHVAFVGSSSGLRIYINGKLVASNAVGYGAPNTGNLTIGTRNSGGERYSGKMDDLRIYNYALTQAQIQQVMNGGAVRFGPNVGSP